MFEVAKNVFLLHNPTTQADRTLLSSGGQHSFKRASQEEEKSQQASERIEVTKRMKCNKYQNASKLVNDPAQFSAP